MRRDLSLVRKLLFFFEAKNDPSAVSTSDIVMEGFSHEMVDYHVGLMCQAGFLSHEAICSKSTPDRIIRVIPFELTWAGHEYLETVRSQEVWDQIKKADDRMGGLTIELVRLIGESFVKKRAKDLLGLTL